MKHPCPSFSFLYTETWHTKAFNKFLHILLMEHKVQPELSSRSVESWRALWSVQAEPP